LTTLACGRANSGCNRRAAKRRRVDDGGNREGARRGGTDAEVEIGPATAEPATDVAPNVVPEPATKGNPAKVEAPAASGSVKTREQLYKIYYTALTKFNAAKKENPRT